jgi:hypothetical protein
MAAATKSNLGKHVGDVYVAGVLLEVHECGECGLIYGALESFFDNRRKDGRTFYCPVGHSRAYTGPTELERERQRRIAAEQQAQSRLELLEHETRSHASTRGHLTRQKRRTAAGVCPVKGCRRHFKNLEAHMRTKHPHAVKEARKS